MRVGDGMMLGMELNPYASFLVDSEPLAVLGATTAKLHELTGKMSEQQIEAPIAAGKWNVRQIVTHLADCELAFGFRLRQALTGMESQPFDQDAWSRTYKAYTLAAALDLFTAARRWNLLFLGALSAADKEIAVTHPERGTMRLWTIAETMAGHDRNHLAQLEKVANA